MIKISSLTPKEKEIVIHKGTEACYTTSFDRMLVDGTYLCRNCGIGLFSNKNQFNSGFSGINNNGAYCLPRLLTASFHTIFSCVLKTNAVFECATNQAFISISASNCLIPQPEYHMKNLQLSVVTFPIFIPSTICSKSPLQ